MDDQSQRNGFEGKIVQTKRVWGLGQIYEKLAATQDSMVAVDMFDNEALRNLLRFLFFLLKTGYITINILDSMMENSLKSRAKSPTSII